MSELVDCLSTFIAQVRGSEAAWPAAELERVLARASELVEVETNFRVLGEALRFDELLELPVDLVVAIYRRLLELGARDARTVLCFARYLLLHGPRWDEEAQVMLVDVEERARSAGLWDAPHLGHHPVFFC